MKIFWLPLVVVLALGAGMTSAYGTPLMGALIPAQGGSEKERMVVAQKKATSGENETEIYQKKVEETITEYKGKLRELEVKAKNLNEKAKAEVKEGMDELQKKVDAAEQKLRSIRSTSGEAWEKMKAEVDSSLESIKESYKKIAARFQ